MLAPYALRDEDSRGRRRPEARHPYRDDFQRDRDRVIHSRAFRRLENKTQVFSHRYSDHFRNRLTHTIEVAQITRTIAAELGLNEDLAETLALVHDVGHPPFGHAGEKALDECMRAHGLAFDHNIHALRIVEHFELRYASFRGLNLTFEVREGIIKHSRDWEETKFPELREYLLNERPPMEAQLIDLTDEIAYNTADLDDGLESELLTLDQVRSGVAILGPCFAEVEKKYPQAPEKLKFNEALKRMLDKLAGDLIANTRKQVGASGVNCADDVRKHPQRLVAFSDEVATQLRACKKFLYNNLYFSPELKKDKEESAEIIRAMFSYWMEKPETLPSSYQQQLKEGAPRARMVCDYIAGMTDNFIREQYRQAIGS